MQQKWTQKQSRRAQRQLAYPVQTLSEENLAKVSQFLQDIIEKWSTLKTSSLDSAIFDGYTEYWKTAKTVLCGEGKKTKLFGKKESFQIKKLGIGLRKLGNIPVDVGDTREKIIGKYMETVCLLIFSDLLCSNTMVGNSLVFLAGEMISKWPETAFVVLRNAFEKYIEMSCLKVKSVDDDDSDTVSLESVNVQMSDLNIESQEKEIKNANIFNIVCVLSSFLSQGVLEDELDKSCDLVFIAIKIILNGNFNVMIDKLQIKEEATEKKANDKEIEKVECQIESINILGNVGKASMEFDVALKCFLAFIMKYDMKIKESEYLRESLLPEIIKTIIKFGGHPGCPRDCIGPCGVAIAQYISHISLKENSNSQIAKYVAKYLINESEEKKSDSDSVLKSFWELLRNVDSPLIKLSVIRAFAHLRYADLAVEKYADTCFYLEVLLPWCLDCCSRVETHFHHIFGFGVLTECLLLLIKILREKNGQIQIFGTVSNDQLCKLSFDRVLAFVWKKWDDSDTSSLDHALSEVFLSLRELDALLCNSSHVSAIVDRFLSKSELEKGRFIAVTMFVPVIGVQYMLEKFPDLLDYLFKAMTRAHLRQSTRIFFEAVLSDLHPTNVVENVENVDNRKLWGSFLASALVKYSFCPTFGVLADAAISAVFNKCKPDALHFLLEEIGKVDVDSGNSSPFGVLHAKLAVINQARVHNIINGIELEMIPGIYDLLLRSIICDNDSIALDALNIVSVSIRLAELPTAMELKIIKKFLVCRFTSNSAATRVAIVSCFRKFFIRLRDSCYKAFRDNMGDPEYLLDEPEQKNTSGGFCAWGDILLFLQWLGQFLIHNLAVSSPHFAKVLSLELYRLWMLNFLNHNNIKIKEFWLEMIFFSKSAFELGSDHVAPSNFFCSVEHFRVLLACLWDDFRICRILAYATLSLALPNGLTGFQSCKPICNVLKQSFTTLNSIKEKIASGSAMAMAIILRADWIGEKITLELVNKKITLSLPLEETPVEDRNQYIIHHTIHICMEIANLLEKYTQIAVKDLVEGASFYPLHGSLELLYHLLNGLEFDDRSSLIESDFARSNPKIISDWSCLIENLIKLANSICTLAFPYLANKSPEGCDPCLTDDVAVEKTDRSKQQLLATYSWLSIKSCGKLLGLLCCKFPFPQCMIDSKDSSQHFFSLSQIEAFGDIFIRIILSTRHKGAIERTFEDFISLCNALVIGTQQLYDLLDKWLSNLLKSFDDSEHLSRRSAGIPFVINAIIAAENKQKLTVKKLTMKAFDSLIEMVVDSSSIRKQTHALNCLCRLLKIKEMKRDVDAYVDKCFLAVISAFSSTSWDVRNAATMVFDTLLLRTVLPNRKQAKDEDLEAETGYRQFFSRFPKIAAVLVVKLTELVDGFRSSDSRINRSENESSSSGNVLYSIFVLLSKLKRCPDDEFVETKKMIGVFIPLISFFAAHPNINIRMKSAEALSQVCTNQDLTTIISGCLTFLKTSHDSNLIHGCLYQLFFIVRKHGYYLQSSEKSVFEGIVNFLTEANCQFLQAQVNKACYPMATLFLELSKTVLSLPLSTSSMNFKSNLLVVCKEFISRQNEECKEKTIVMKYEFLRLCVEFLIEEFLFPSQDIFLIKTSDIIDILQCNVFEAVSKALKMLYSYFDKISQKNEPFDLGHALGDFVRRTTGPLFEPFQLQNVLLKMLIDGKFPKNVPIIFRFFQIPFLPFPVEIVIDSLEAFTKSRPLGEDNSTVGRLLGEVLCADIAVESQAVSAFPVFGMLIGTALNFQLFDGDTPLSDEKVHKKLCEDFISAFSDIIHPSNSPTLRLAGLQAIEHVLPFALLNSKLKGWATLPSPTLHIFLQNLWIVLISSMQDSCEIVRKHACLLVSWLFSDSMKLAFDSGDIADMSFAHWISDEGSRDSFCETVALKKAFKYFGSLAGYSDIWIKFHMKFFNEHLENIALSEDECSQQSSLPVVFEAEKDNNYYDPVLLMDVSKKQILLRVNYLLDAFAGKKGPKQRSSAVSLIFGLQQELFDAISDVCFSLLKRITSFSESYASKGNRFLYYPKESFFLMNYSLANCLDLAKDTCNVACDACQLVPASKSITLLGDIGEMFPYDPRLYVLNPILVTWYRPLVDNVITNMTAPRSRGRRHSIAETSRRRY